MTVFAVVLDGWRWTLHESGCAAWTDAVGREWRSASIHGQAVHRNRRSRAAFVRLVDGRVDEVSPTLPQAIVDRAVESLREMRRAA